ncbi:MAG: hypothetical protein V3V25_08615 [Paracoccaceae bacterium]
MQNSPNTDKNDALKISHALPEAVLLEPLSPSFTKRFSDSGAVWLCAEPSLLKESNDTDTSPDWQARCGKLVAVPAQPNTGNSQRVMVAGVSCLAFQPRMNCGYCIPEAISGNSPFSIAVIYAPSLENEPRSLVTINPADADNYLFLSERDDAIELTDKQGDFSLRQPVMRKYNGFRLVVLSCTNEGYALALSGNKQQRTKRPVENSTDNETQIDATGPSDLFIGCRSHRKGILKTLGELSLADIFLWPDKDILAFDNDGSDENSSPEHDLLLKYFNEVISREV